MGSIYAVKVLPPLCNLISLRDRGHRQPAYRQSGEQSLPCQGEMLPGSPLDTVGCLGSLPMDTQQRGGSDEQYQHHRTGCHFHGSLLQRTMSLNKIWDKSTVRVTYLMSRTVPGRATAFSPRTGSFENSFNTITRPLWKNAFTHKKPISCVWHFPTDLLASPQFDWEGKRVRQLASSAARPSGFLAGVVYG